MVAYRLRTLIAITLLAAGAGTSGARVSSPSPAVSAATVREDRFPVVEAHYAGGIVARPHVEFANLGGYRPLQLDLYLHRDRGRSPPRPLVLWIHGGGWRRGDSRQSGAFTDFPAVLAGLAARGYVVASVDYRLSEEARFPAQIQDVKAAIAWLRANAGAFGIDPKRVIAWGGSAGGHLAALAATSCGEPAYAPLASTGRLTRREAEAARPPADPGCVQGAVSWYGALDLAAYRPDGAPAPSDNVFALLGCAASACEDRMLAASPVYRVDSLTAPMLLIHGTADEEVSDSAARLMADRMRAAGRPVELLLIPNVGHGFIARDPARTRAASLQALARTYAWLNSQTGTR
jgi:acetyl esterase/lipase